MKSLNYHDFVLFKSEMHRLLFAHTGQKRKARQQAFAFFRDIGQALRNAVGIQRLYRFKIGRSVLKIQLFGLVAVKIIERNNLCSPAVFLDIL